MALTISSYQRELTKAFQKDAENLLCDFNALKSFKFSDFAQIWRNHKFSFVNSNQKYYSIINQYVSNCFFVLKKFIVFPGKVHIQVGALYLMYSLYFKQIVKDWVKIRITYKEHQKLQELINYLQLKKLKEPLYCYAKLVVENAFEYVFRKTILAPESRYTKNFRNYTDDLFQVDTKPYFRLEQLMNRGDFHKKFTEVNKKYDRLLAEFSTHNPGLKVLQSTVIQDIQGTLNELKEFNAPRCNFSKNNS